MYQKSVPKTSTKIIGTAVSCTSDMQFWYRIFLVPVFGNEQKTMLYFRAGLWYRFSGNGFRCRFLVRVSLALRRPTSQSARCRY